MRSTPGTGDDHVKTHGLGMFGKAEQFIRRTVGGDNFDMERDIQRGQNFGRGLHSGPVTF
ncbi:hypothetical protein D3C78_1821490 [compost metagenome]